MPFSNAQDRANYVAHTINSDASDDYRQALADEHLRESNAVKGFDGKRVLLIGGGGYIGCVVAQHLLALGYRVTIFDNFIYGHYFAVLSLLDHPNLTLVCADVRDKDEVSKALKNATDMVVLGGLVGDPITKTYPELSEAINDRAIASLIEYPEAARLNKIVFISTCSNYGLVEGDAVADEEYELAPLSLYAQAKVRNEQIYRGANVAPTTVLRFATAFGYAPRMRFDLTVNEFTAHLAANQALEVYDADTWRPYCHVKDFAQVIRRILEAPVDRVSGEVFNVGSDENNFTKKMIVDEIQKHVDSGAVTYRDQGADRRNYRVDFSKLARTLEYTPQVSVGEGIREIAEVVQTGIFRCALSRQNSFHGNYEIKIP